MKMRSFFLLLISLPWLAPYAAATTISFTTTNVTGNSWQYQYSVTNDSLPNPIDEFTIYFDRNNYSNLNVAASPPGWDALVTQPDFAIPADGFFDALALVQGVVPGATIGGFAVSFQYLGAGTPSSQFFEIVDPINLAVIDSGLTTPASVPPPPSTSVPEPSSIALAAMGLTALLVRRSKPKTPAKLSKI